LVAAPNQESVSDPRGSEVDRAKARAEPIGGSRFAPGNAGRRRGDWIVARTSAIERARLPIGIDSRVDIGVRRRCIVTSIETGLANIRLLTGLRVRAGNQRADQRYGDPMSPHATPYIEIAGRPPGMNMSSPIEDCVEGLLRGRCAGPCRRFTISEEKALRIAGTRVAKMREHVASAHRAASTRDLDDRLHIA
jgi:hypothetical protein